MNQMFSLSLSLSLSLPTCTRVAIVVQWKTIIARAAVATHSVDAFLCAPIGEGQSALVDVCKEFKEWVSQVADLLVMSKHIVPYNRAIQLSTRSSLVEKYVKRTSKAEDGSQVFKRT